MLALSLAASACGGGDGDESAQAWAAGVCADLSTWVTDVEAAIASITEEGFGFGDADVRKAIDQARRATDELVDELRQLEPPEVERSDDAQEELDRLTDELRDQLRRVEDAVEADRALLELVATVSAAISAAADEVEQTLAALQRLGEALDEAFRTADECDTLREQVRRAG